METLPVQESSLPSMELQHSHCQRWSCPSNINGLLLLFKHKKPALNHSRTAKLRLMKSQSFLETYTSMRNCRKQIARFVVAANFSAQANSNYSSGMDGLVIATSNNSSNLTHKDAFPQQRHTKSCLPQMHDLHHGQGPLLRMEKRQKWQSNPQ
jgi:hypothetical protein